MRIALLPAAFVALALAAPLTLQTTFERAYYHGSRDQAHSVAQTTDGGYIIAGWTATTNWISEDIRLIKTDAFGDTLWTRTYGGEGLDWGYSVAQTADGGYIIAGETKCFGAGGSDVYLVRTDPNGDTLWTRTYGGAENERGHSVAQTADGGYIIAGYTWSFGAGSVDAWLVKTDASGDTIWTRTFGGEDRDGCYSVVQTTDGGYIIAGETWSFGAGRGDAWLIKTDADGDTMWTRTWGGGYEDCGWSVAQTTDSGYVISGHTGFFSGQFGDAWLIKTDPDGGTMWVRMYRSVDASRGHSVAQTADGGYIINGWIGSRYRHTGLWLIKTDASGDTMWTRVFSNTDGNHYYGYSVAQTADGGYAVAGSFWISFLGAALLIKTDSDGRVVTAGEPDLPVVHKPAPATIARAVLYVPQPTTRNWSFALLDCVGRKVMDLQPGPNNIRHLSPGVYFVHEASSVEREASSIRKVVITH